MNFYNAPVYSADEIMAKDESAISFPYSCPADATWNGMRHQYTPTRNYFEDRGRNLDVEIDGNDPEKVRIFLDYVRLKCYGWIYSHSKSSRAQINYMIAKHGLRGFTMFEYRQEFIEGMYIQGCYMLDNGDISSISGVDLDTMQNMSADVIRNQDRDMHPNAIKIFTQLGLSFYGRYRFMPRGQGKEW